MPHPLGLSVMVMPLQLADLFTEPMGFLAVWLLFGWLLFRSSRPAPATEDPTVIEHQHLEQADDEQRGRGLELVALGIALYVLLRYWRNR